MPAFFVLEERMTSELPIRAALPTEAEAIRDLVRAAYAKWVPLIGREPRPMQADYVQALLVHRFDVIGPEGSPLALIETKDRGDHLWIENIAVAPERQGQGLGHRLLAHAEALARQLALPELKLLLNKKFEANLRLYRSVGFEVEREEPFLDGITVYMRRRLPG